MTPADLEETARQALAIRYAARVDGRSSAARQLRKQEARPPTDALSAFGDFVPWDS